MSLLGIGKGLVKIAIGAVEGDLAKVGSGVIKTASGTLGTVLSIAVAEEAGVIFSEYSEEDEI
jgi:hypothetical protein